MLMCPCGNMTSAAQARSAGAVLRWQQCGSCGRCGSFELRVDGVQVARGRVARRVFADAAALERVRKRVSGAAEDALGGRAA